MYYGVPKLIDVYVELKHRGIDENKIAYDDFESELMHFCNPTDSFIKFLRAFTRKPEDILKNHFTFEKAILSVSNIEINNEGYDYVLFPVLIWGLESLRPFIEHYQISEEVNLWIAYTLLENGCLHIPTQIQWINDLDIARQMIYDRLNLDQQKIQALMDVTDYQYYYHKFETIQSLVISSKDSIILENDNLYFDTSNIKEHLLLLS